MDQTQTGDKKALELRVEMEAALKQVEMHEAGCGGGLTTKQWAWVLGVSPITFGKRRHRLIQAGQMRHCGHAFPLTDDGKPYRAPLWKLV